MVDQQYSFRPRNIRIESKCIYKYENIRQKYNLLQTVVMEAEDKENADLS
jgi:hypothetical protein